MRDLLDIVSEASGAPPASPLTNPAFVAWFRNSVLVDASGEPMVLYHGTSKEFDTFKLPGRNEYRPKAIFLATDAGTAEYFTYGRGSIMPVYVRAENPFDYREPTHIERLRKFLSVNFSSKVPGALYSVDAAIKWLQDGDFGLIEQPSVQAWMKKSKFDSFYVTEANGKLNIGVFSPNQVKSVYNVGTFSQESNKVSEGFSFLRSLLSPGA